MKNFCQHGCVSTYDHCQNVTRVSFWLNKKFNLKADEESLLKGAFLHDFYLYDWHHKNACQKLHGFSHAQTAADNAKKFFDLNEKELNIISSHMWPLNITKLPKSREAFIVTIADKLCSLHETLAQRNKAVSICN